MLMLNESRSEGILRLLAPQYFNGISTVFHRLITPAFFPIPQSVCPHQLTVFLQGAETWGIRSVSPFTTLSCRQTVLETMQIWEKQLDGSEGGEGGTGMGIRPVSLYDTVNLPRRNDLELVPATRQGILPSGTTCAGNVSYSNKKVSNLQEAWETMHCSNRKTSAACHIAQWLPYSDRLNLSYCKHLRGLLRPLLPQWIESLQLPYPSPAPSSDSRGEVNQMGGIFVNGRPLPLHMRMTIVEMFKVGDIYEMTVLLGTTAVKQM